MFRDIIAAQQHHDVAQAQRSLRDAKTSTIMFGPWPKGEHNERRAEQLKANELSSSLNMIIVEDGTLRTRIGLTEKMTGMDGDVVDVLDANVGGTWYHFAVDNDAGTYKLWFDESGSGTATAIASLGGEARLLSFMGLLFIMDGGHMRMITSMTFAAWVTTTVYAIGDLVTNSNVGYRCIAAHTAGDLDDEPGVGAVASTYWEEHWDDIVYDTGGGTTEPYQYTNRGGSDDTTLDIDNVNDRVGQKITTHDWDTDDDMPATHGYVTLSKSGAPTGDVNCVIRLVSDDSAVVTTVIEQGENITGVAVEYDFAITPADRTKWLAKNTAYYFSIECADTDAAKKIHVHCTTVASGGLAYEYPAGAGPWANDATANCIVALKPGHGAGGHFVDGIVWEDRMYCIEGASGTSPSAIHYCNAGNHLDWSTPSAGGVFYCIDESTTNFPVGGLVEFYDAVWVFGLQKQPFMGKLTGSPGTYAIENTLQELSGHYKTLISTPESAWHLHKAGIGSVRTIQEYGDVRASAEALGWRSIISDNYDTTAFSGYEPNFGTYLVKLNGYDEILAVSTQVIAGAARGQVRVPFSPVTRWELAITDDPTCFGRGEGICYVGTDAGKTYYFDPTAFEDDDVAITFLAKPNFQSTKFGQAEAMKVNWNTMGKFGGTFNLKFYRNHNQTAFLTKSITVPWDTSVDVTEMTMSVQDMLFLVDPDKYHDRIEPNFDFRSIMVTMEDIVLYGAPLLIGGITGLAKPTGGL